MRKVENKDNSTAECFQVLVDKLQRIQQLLAKPYKNDKILKDRLLIACWNVEDCAHGCFRAAPTFEELYHDLLVIDFGRQLERKDETNTETY